MNERQHDQTLYTVATYVLESLALMFLVPEDEASPLPCCNRRVVVAFTGPFDGSLVLAASDDMLLELAANMLGLESGRVVTMDQQEDALKELVNVVCGNLLPAIAGKEPVFQIGAPEVRGAEQSPHRAGNTFSAGQAHLLTDAGSIELELFVSQPSAVLG